MIRLVLSEAAGVRFATGEGPIIERMKTFDVDLPEVENWLAESVVYGQRSFVGIEIIPDKAGPERGQ